MNLQHIELREEGPILYVVLNRPEKRNAVNGVMHKEIAAVMREVDFAFDARVIVLTGAGTAFCSGGDISGWTGPTGTNLERRPAEIYDEGRRLVDAILWVEKPLIAMVNGPAIGLGATLALLCDVVYAADDAIIGDRHVKFAAVAGDGGAALWPLLVGLNHAKELLMSGRTVTGAEAARIGLVNKAVPRAELEELTRAYAMELAELDPFSVRATKASINRHLRRSVEDTLDLSIAYEKQHLGHGAHRTAASDYLATRATEKSSGES